MVAVLDQGWPRALIKAGPDHAGSISAAHDDSFLSSTETGGEFIAVADGMRRARGSTC